MNSNKPTCADLLKSTTINYLNPSIPVAPLDGKNGRVRLRESAKKLCAVINDQPQTDVVEPTNTNPVVYENGKPRGRPSKNKKNSKPTSCPIG